MNASLKRVLIAALVALQSGAARAADDAFTLFEEEAQVVSASLRPTSAAEAPAMVRVVTADELKARGVKNIWDALRAVPGVDVTQTRAYQAEVGIRGMNGAFNNRVLVLLDGKTVQNAMFDYVLWESIPVTIEEIERIEVVEGPASALYGANAISGVINIITKTPDRLGGLVTASAGEAGYGSGAVLYGTRRGKLDYKVAAGARTGNRFEDESVPGTRSSRIHAGAGWDFSDDERLSVRGGLTKLDTQTTTGSAGKAFETGDASFLRADYRRGEGGVTAFWNRERALFREFEALNNPSVDYDTFDVSAKRELSLPFDDRLVVGAGYRRSSSRSQVLGPGLKSQDLWSLFFENEWKPRAEWTVVASGRLDRHPLTPLLFSPRGSVIYQPSETHVLRASAGTSFRNPTMLESYLRFTQTVANSPGGSLPNPPFSSLEVASSGRDDLMPEKMLQAELSHAGRFGAVQTTLTGWYYKLHDRILSTNPALLSGTPPTARLASSYANGGGTRALGFEAGVDARLSRALTGFANYSYQSLRDDDPSTQTTARSSPRHKANAGLTAKRRGLTVSLWGAWVDRTFWNENQSASGISYRKVPDYLILSAGVGYAFPGRWEGLEASVGAFNLADRRHHEILPASGAAPGQNGEIIRSRWTGTLSYRFGGGS